MRIRENGRSYEMDSMQGTNPQVVEFFQRTGVTNREYHNEESGEDLPDYFFTKMGIDPDGFYGGKTTENDGTTPEEVIKVLVAHYEHFQQKLPCEENENILELLSDIQLEQRKRAERRKSEGTFATLTES